MMDVPENDIRGLPCLYAGIMHFLKLAIDSLCLFREDSLVLYGAISWSCLLQYYIEGSCWNFADFHLYRRAKSFKTHSTFRLQNYLKAILCNRIELQVKEAFRVKTVGANWRDIREKNVIPSTQILRCRNFIDEFQMAGNSRESLDCHSSPFRLRKRKQFWSQVHHFDTLYCSSQFALIYQPHCFIYFFPYQLQMASKLGAWGTWASVTRLIKPHFHFYVLRISFLSFYLMLLAVFFSLVD